MINFLVQPASVASFVAIGHIIHSSFIEGERGACRA
jgi:hypothetical protein